MMLKSVVLLRCLISRAQDEEERRGHNWNTTS